MRLAVRHFVLCGLLTGGLAAPAAAEWHLTPLIGLTFLGDTTIVDVEGATGDVHWNFGGAVALVGAGPVGVEGLVVYTPGFFDRDDLNLVKSSRSVAVMGNVVLTVPRRWTEYGLRPLFSGGLGLFHASVSDFIDALPASENLLGYNVGGGAVGFLSDSIGLRFDLRYFSQLRREEEGGVSFGPVRLSYWTATVGVVFR